MPTRLIPGTSLFVTIFISAIVTILHAFNYGSIDLILVSMLICGSIVGVQIGQKVGESIDSSELKTLLAVLLLAVGIAIAYDSFFAVHEAKQMFDGDTKNLGPFANFIRNLSKDFPIQYGIISIIFAIVLGIAGAFIRRFFSNLRKKYIRTN
jgi:NAD/NADP transhydrogenase beta subunit